MQSKYRSYYGAEIESHFRAKKLRRDETSAEWLFWQMVRNRKVMGFKFKRQRPIGSYYADFYCHDAKLVVELDGDIHNIESVKKRNEIREANIRGLGLHVMRFSNDDVFKNGNWLSWIWKNTSQTILSETIRPHPNPLLKGEGTVYPTLSTSG